MKWIHLQRQGGSGRTILTVLLSLFLLVSMNTASYAQTDDETYVVEGEGGNSGYTLQVVEDPDAGEEIQEEAVPLAAAPDPNWGIANLFLLILTCALAGAGIAGRRRSRRGWQAPGEQPDGFRRSPRRIAANVIMAAAAAASLVAFLLTEDFRTGAGVTDPYTFVMGYLFLIALAGTILSRRWA